MNFKNNPPFWLMTGIALVLAFILWLHKCPVCPELKTVHTVTSDSAMFHDELDSSTIKATSITPRKKTNPTSKLVDVEGIKVNQLSKTGVSKDSSILDMKKSFVESVDMCDSLKTEHESDHVFDIDISDSVMTGHIQQTISEDQVTKFSFRRAYKFPVTTDSTIQTVSVPSYKNAFTYGGFGGGNKVMGIAGLSLGYRTKEFNLQLQYDFINGFKLINITRDFK